MGTKNKTKSIMRIAFERSSKKYVSLSLPLSIFTLLVIISLLITYFASTFIIVLVPFVILPAFFALTSMSVIVEKKQGREATGFFFMFRNYFSRLFRGGYRVWISLLLGLAAMFFTSIILSVIFSNTVLANDQLYHEFLNSIQSIGDLDTFYNVFNEYLNADPTFRDVIAIVTVFGTFAGIWTMMHCISVNSVKMYHNLLTRAPLPTPDLNLVHKDVMRKVRSSFYRDYYAGLWFFLLLIPLGMCSGYFLCRNVLINVDANQAVVIGMGIVFILLLFFIPYYLTVVQILYEKNSSKYIECFIDLSMKSIEQIKKTMKIDPDKEKEIIEFLDKTKEQNKSIDKDDKE